MNNYRIILLGLTCLFVMGCNTVEGLGHDITASGKAIQGVAQKAKGSMHGTSEHRG